MPKTTHRLVGVVELSAAWDAAIDPQLIPTEETALPESTLRADLLQLHGELAREHHRLVGRSEVLL